MINYLLSICFLLFLVFSFPPDHQIKVKQLQEDVYLYQSFAIYEGQQISANGLVAVSEEEVVLVDTPWDEAQTRQLLQWIQEKIGKPVAFAVITHAHMDRIGGIDVLKAKGIPTISGKLTVKKAIENGYSSPDYSFQSDTLLTYGTSSLEVFYPGPGHTEDNTVVYLNDQHLLHGGCFIKNASASSLGNLEDANIQRWPQSMENVNDRYPNRNIVIPGHGTWKPGAIENTLHLLSKEE